MTLNQTQMQGLRSVALTAALLVAATAGSAAQELIDATDPGRIVKIAEGFGSAMLETDTQGDPKIVGRIDGIRYVVLFYGCKDKSECQTIQFYAGWTNPDGKITHEEVNDWNRDNRFSKAYLDDEGDPAIELDVSLERGVSQGNLDEWFDWWQTAIVSFEKEVINKG